MPRAALHSATAVVLGTTAAMPAAAFPMHVLPVARVLALKRLPTYEEIKDELVEQRDGMHTVFVSQTWLTRTHPDTAENVKLTLLQSFLRDASAGKKGVKPSLLCEIFWGGRLKIPARALRRYNTYGSTCFPYLRWTRHDRARR